MSLTVKDLRPAKYNPRSISERRLNELEKSFGKFGDLSGVVFNQRTRTLVSGHQRLKANAGKKSKIETRPHFDGQGTIALGYILFKNGKSEFKVPLRIVDWSDKKTEKAANIAANAHGGDWDKEKLAVVLRDLQDGEFDIELTGLDPLTLRTLKIEENHEGPGKNSGSKRNEFKELNSDTVLTKHKCPKCGFKF